MKQIAGLLFTLFVLLLSQSFAQEAIPPQDPTGGVQHSAEWLLNQGREQLESRRYDQAIASFTQAIKLKPEMIMAHHGLTTAYLRLGNTAKAQESAQRALEAYPFDVNLHMVMGEVLLASRQLDAAIVEYRKVTQLAPGFSTGFYNLGTTYLQSGKPAEAVAALQEAVRLNPRWASAHMNLALGYLAIKKDNEGIAELKEALKVEPNAYFAADRLGREGIRLERLNDALQGYEWLSRAPIALEAQACDRITYAALYVGKGELAARSAQDCLQIRGKQDRAVPYLTLFQYFGWRQAKGEKQAAAALIELQSQLSQRPSQAQWPLPVVRYLRRELTAEELLKLAGNNDEQTEAHTYLGCDLSISGQKEAALLHLRWVKENGNRNFIEYPLAVLELHRLTSSEKK